MNCKPKEWTIADYEMAIKHTIEQTKPGEIIDGQMWISVYQKIIDEKKGKRKSLKQLRDTFHKLKQITTK